MAAADETAQIQAIMLQEAQQEVGKLRAELYGARRAAEDRRQAMEAAVAAQTQLQGSVQQLEQQVQALRDQLLQMRQLQQQHDELQELHAKLQKDSQVHLQARRILEEELRDERQARTSAEESRAVAEAERSRLQRALDETTTQLRIVQQKAAEAEEEQLRAEEELVALQQELATLQQQQQTEDGEATTGVAGSRSSVSQGDSGMEALQHSLDVERGRSAQLHARATAAEAEAAAAQQKMQLLQLQLESQGAQAAAGASSSRGAEQHASSSTADVAQLWHQLEQLQATNATLHQDKQQLHLDKQQLQQQLLQAQAQAQAATAKAAAAASASHGAAAAAGGGGGDHGAGAAADVRELQQELAALQDQVELLMGKLVVLKKSRDRLLLQLDAQGQELDGLAAENQTLVESAKAAKEQADLWQAQVQESLGTIARLQDCMEESAAWSSTTPAPTATAEGGQEAPVDKAVQLQEALLKEQAQRAKLELQVAALCAEVLRLHTAQQTYQRCMVPLLSGVEGRLLALHALAAQQ